MNAPFLSVIVPVYRAEQWLSRCVDSILAQTFRDFELILVDDGSPDRCPAICDEYAQQDSRVRVLHQPNGGTVPARKAGTELAQGRYVTFADSDDWLDPCAYASAVEALEDADVLAMGFLSETPQGQIPERNELPNGVYTGAQKKALFESLLYTGQFYQSGICPALWCKFFKKELISTIFPAIPEILRMGEDAALVYPVLMDAEKVVVRNDLRHYHYIRGFETLSTAYDALYFSRIEALYRTMDQMLSARNEKIHQEQFPYYMLFLLTVGFQQQLNPRGKQFFTRNRALWRILAEPWLAEAISPVSREQVPAHIYKLKDAICRKKRLRIFFGYYGHIIRRKLCR